MCDCMPNHIKYSFRCKKRRNNSFLGLRLNYALEFTIIHFWIYMVFLGVIIAFILKSVGCYLQRRSISKYSREPKVETCDNYEPLPRKNSICSSIQNQRCNDNISCFRSNCSMLKPVLSDSSDTFDSKLARSIC